MAAKPQTFRDVTVWSKAHVFTLAVYRCTDELAKHAHVAFTSRLRRDFHDRWTLVAGSRKRPLPLRNKPRFSNLSPGSPDECLDQPRLVRHRWHGATTPVQADLEAVSHLLHGVINSPVGA